MNWRPIETAPRNGDSFIAWAHEQMWFAWRFDLENAHGSWHGWYGTNQSWADDSAGEIQPTHWMPLPEPPASGMEARQGRDAAERLDGEAATARPDAQPLEPKD